jgi:hypothetical protein
MPIAYRCWRAKLQKHGVAKNTAADTGNKCESKYTNVVEAALDRNHCSRNCKKRRRAKIKPQGDTKLMWVASHPFDIV